MYSKQRSYVICLDIRTNSNIDCTTLTDSFSDTFEKLRKANMSAFVRSSFLPSFVHSLLPSVLPSSFFPYLPFPTFSFLSFTFLPFLSFLPACLPQRPHKTQLGQGGFSWNLIFSGLFENLSRKFTFRKSVEELQVSNNNRRDFTRRHTFFVSHLAQFFSQWEMFRTKVVETIKTHILCSANLISKIVPFMR